MFFSYKFFQKVLPANWAEIAELPRRRLYPPNLYAGKLAHRA
jgi:hypothetical protein